MTAISIVVDCICGLRYMKSEIATVNLEAGQFNCPCGETLGAWDGASRLVFEAEETPLLH